MLRPLLSTAALLASASGRTCTSDLDCALNGVCTTAGRCACDAAWEGEQCERFAFVPGPVDADVNSPWATPDLQTSTWGLGTLQRPVDGEQHLFGTELTGSCGIGAWQTNSATVHWVSRTPKTGPWQRKGVALPAQATCASTARAPNGSLIMMLFGGTRSTPKERVPKNYPQGDPVHHMFCRNGSTPCGFSKHGCTKRPTIDRPYHDAPPLGAAGTALAAGGSLPDCAHCKGTACLATGCSLPMYVADGPDGPWRTIRANLDTMAARNLNFTGSFSIAGPWIDSNGTTTTILQVRPLLKRRSSRPLLTAFFQTGDYDDHYPASLRLNNIGAVIRADRFEGPYTVIARNACGPGEDMYIWQDTRGHWHCVWHNTGHTSANHGPHQDGEPLAEQPPCSTTADNHHGWTQVGMRSLSRATIPGSASMGRAGTASAPPTHRPRTTPRCGTRRRTGA